MASGSILPQELLCRPTALIALTGLDITYNAIHKLIWDSFCNNRRPDRVPLQFKVVPGDHEYPKCGTNKRQTYEWYIPKGILKTSWMNKHLYKIPAVVVVFFDLDWDEALWKEKQMECATRVEIVRNSLQGRAAKVVVVLIQKNAPLPPGEDVVAAERATSLCSACELSAKHLYVLPHTDHLIGYTIRLENAFYELAQSYYHGEARKVKSHRDFLNKTTHQLLFVRHQFKIAFYQELKQDSHTALKHYKQAYGHLLELRMHDTNILEIKTIAGFINYKICRLSFQHNAPLDSIAQFRKHIDFFKGKVGLSELAFEHSAWMSKQFQVFGDLFDEAIKLGLAAIQTQHPGFYYQQAANHAINRKHLCRGLCKPLTTLLHSNPLEQLDSLDYFGQRPWRQGHQSIDPPDLQKEKEGIAALQNQELQVDHSWQIIPLLSSAVSQFKKYKSPRMKRFLMVQMGEEYYHARDHVKSLTLLSKVTWDYRVERWWSLLASVLDIALKCSYLTANIGCYVSNCLELIGKYTGKPPEERTRIQMNLIRVISNDAPEPEPGLDAVCIESARGLWSSQTEAYSFNVDMQNIASFIECKATFTRDSFPADTEVHVQVYIQVNCQFPVRFSKLSVTLNNQIYNQYCQVVDGHEISAASEHDGNEGNLYLVPMETRVFEFSFLPVKDESHEIHDILLEINSIILELGSENGRCAHLKWIGSGGSMVTSPAQGNLYPRRSKKDKPVDINELDIIQITKVVPRKANIDVHIEHQLPCLLNEFFLIEVEATNREESAIKDLRLACGFNENDDSASGIDITSHICLEKPFFDGKVENHAVEIISSSLNPGEKVKKKIFLKHMSLGNKSINLKLMYAVTIHKNNKEILCLCEHIETVAMTIVSPFEVSVRLNSLKFEQIEVIQQEEPVLLMTDIKCTSPWSVELQSSKVQMDVGVKLTDEETLSQLEGVCLKTGECASETVCLQTHNFNQPMVSLGTYTIHWRRNTPEYPDAPYISTSFPLPEMKTDHVPISMELKLPAFGRVKELLPLCYVIYNRTQYPQEMEVTMEANDSFMFSGNKQFHFRILPSKAYNLTYNLFPLIAGHIALPKIHITMVRYQDNIDSLAQKMLPSHVFIKPTGKHISVYEEKFCKEI